MENLEKNNEENSKQIINDKLEGEKYKIKDIKAKILIAIAFLYYLLLMRSFFPLGLLSWKEDQLLYPR